MTTLNNKTKTLYICIYTNPFIIRNMSPGFRHSPHCHTTRVHTAVVSATTKLNTFPEFVLRDNTNTRVRFLFSATFYSLLQCRVFTRNYQYLRTSSIIHSTVNPRIKGRKSIMSSFVCVAFCRESVGTNSLMSVFVEGSRFGFSVARIMLC